MACRGGGERGGGAFVSMLRIGAHELRLRAMRWIAGGASRSIRQKLRAIRTVVSIRGTVAPSATSDTAIWDRLVAITAWSCVWLHGWRSCRRRRSRCRGMPHSACRPHLEGHHARPPRHGQRVLQETSRGSRSGGRASCWTRAV